MLVLKYCKVVILYNVLYKCWGESFMVYVPETNVIMVRLPRGLCIVLSHETISWNTGWSILGHRIVSMSIIFIGHKIAHYGTQNEGSKVRLLVMNKELLHL